MQPSEEISTIAKPNDRLLTLLGKHPIVKFLPAKHVAPCGMSFIGIDFDLRLFTPGFLNCRNHALRSFSWYHSVISTGKSVDWDFGQILRPLIDFWRHILGPTWAYSS